MSALANPRPALLSTGVVVSSLRRRAVAWALDAFIFGWIATHILDLLGLRHEFEVGPAGFLAGLAAVVVAYAAFDASPAGMTPGKWLCGIRVVAADGTRLPFPRALLRRLTYLAEGVLLGVGWLVAGDDPQRRTWHDRAARSLVVRMR